MKKLLITFVFTATVIFPLLAQTEAAAESTFFDRSTIVGTVVGMIVGGLSGYFFGKKGEK